MSSTPSSRSRSVEPELFRSVQVMVRLFPSTTVKAPTGEMMTVWATDTPSTPTQEDSKQQQDDSTRMRGGLTGEENGKHFHSCTTTSWTHSGCTQASCSGCFAYKSSAKSASPGSSPPPGTTCTEIIIMPNRSRTSKSCRQLHSRV